MDWQHWGGDLKTFRGDDIAKIPEKIPKKVLSLRPPCRILRDNIMALGDFGRFTGIEKREDGDYIVFLPLNRPTRRLKRQFFTPKDIGKEELVYVKINPAISLEIATDFENERIKK